MKFISKTGFWYLLTNWPCLQPLRLMILPDCMSTETLRTENVIPWILLWTRKSSTRTNIFQVEEVLDFSWNLGNLHRPWYLNILFHPAFQIGQYLISSNWSLPQSSSSLSPVSVILYCLFSLWWYWYFLNCYSSFTCWSAHLLLISSFPRTHETAFWSFSKHSILLLIFKWLQPKKLGSSRHSRLNFTYMIFCQDIMMLKLDFIHNVVL